MFFLSWFYSLVFTVVVDMLKTPYYKNHYFLLFLFSNLMHFYIVLMDSVNSLLDKALLDVQLHKIVIILCLWLCVLQFEGKM